MRPVRVPGTTGAEAWRSGWTAWLISTVAWSVVATAAVLLAWTVVPAAIGWQADVVLSGSMEPRLHVGDVVVSRPVPADVLRPGQVLVVEDPDRPGAHRVHRLVSLGPDGLQLRGDANPTPDSAVVPVADVLGRATLRVPAVGLLLVWVRGGDVVPLAGVLGALVGLVQLGLLHRPARPRARRSALLARLSTRTRSAWLLVGVVVLLLGAVAGGQVSPARATFSGRTASAAPWTATWWTCDAAIRAAGATRYYAMQESTAFLLPQTAANRGTLGPAAAGTYSTGQALGQAGPACGGADTRAAAFNADLVSALLPTQVLTTPGGQPAPTDTTVQVWFRTDEDGTLVAFADRLALYVDTAGRLALGIDDGARRGITGSARVADGLWHLATASVGGSGARLYVDGVLLGSDATMTGVRSGPGAWQFGDGWLWGWPAAPLDGHLSGWLAHGAVFPTVLSDAQVALQSAVVTR